MLNKNFTTLNAASIPLMALVPKIRIALEEHNPDFMGEDAEQIFDVKKMEETLSEDYGFEALSEDWTDFIHNLLEHNISLLKVT